VKGTNTIMLHRYRTGFGRSAGWIIAQTFIVGFAMVAALLTPPQTGAILLLPLGHSGPGVALQRALETGARLEGAGPITGTFVVDGERSRLAPAMFNAGVLILAAPAPLCGRSRRAAA
jgi:hypothetical protein